MGSSIFDKKPTTTTSGAVPGTGPIRPNAGDRKQFHYIEDIYDPDVIPDDEAFKYVVPREGELVYDVLNDIIYWVSHVDLEATLKSTLLPWYAASGGCSNDEENIYIYGLPGGFNQGERVLSVDYSVLPNRAVVDKRILCPNAAYALLYEGTIYGGAGKIISATFSSSSVMENNRVPVSLAEIDERTNKVIMTTDEFSVTLNQESLVNGSRTTLVFYDKGGNFLPPAYILGTHHSAYLRDHNVGTKYVTNVELLAPWFTDSNQPDMLMIPINLPLISIAFRAKVYYNDGSSDIQNVDGSKFVLWGIPEWKPTAPGGAEGQLVLRYSLSDNEQVMDAQPGLPKTLSRKYRVQASQPSGAYSPKIYTYPSPMSTGGYELKHYLYNLDRDEVIDVTKLVTLNDSSPSFDPTGYGTQQHLIFNLRLSDANPKYSNWILVQTTTVTLYKSASEVGRKWNINYSNVPEITGYEGQPIAIYRGTFKLNNDLLTFDDWLKEYYYPTQPQYSTSTEECPIPNYFDIYDGGGNHWRYGADKWNTVNTIGKDYVNGDTLYIRWVKRNDDGTELQLACSGVYVVNNTTPFYTLTFGYDTSNDVIDGYDKGYWKD